MIHYIFLIIALVLNASANIFMKLGVPKLGNLAGLSKTEIAIAVFTNLYIPLGVFLFAFNIIFYILALSRINLSIAYPIMTSGGFLIITLFSFHFLKEPITLIQVLGIIFLAVGIILVSFKF